MVSLSTLERTQPLDVADVLARALLQNTFWCTDQRPDHIDISCSAFSSIVDDRQTIGNIGSLNVWVRPVDCSVGLGVKTL
jgi:hypothetical protein